MALASCFGAGLAPYLMQIAREVKKAGVPKSPANAAFPRSARLVRKAEFAHVFAHGRRIGNRYFGCHLAVRDGVGARLGMAVSRKVGKAVIRNRVKRYVREYFRTHREHFTPDLQLIVVARPAAAELGFDGAARELSGLLRRGGFFHG